ncbi:hypothetical protein DB31_3852 [Hyalangium minutum]|uniref:Sigma-54 factor interaction domain-containing protein n=1 Tax=Hyalangium minutum TaxID=394096 RepID=A0A085W4X5_9BACT|nr:hypothetical protein DB31_3852 [Hyalangium minutum]
MVELSLEQQAQLLRVLERGEVKPVGAARAFQVVVRGVGTGPRKGLKSLKAAAHARKGGGGNRTRAGRCATSSRIAPFPRNRLE